MFPRPRHHHFSQRLVLLCIICSLSLPSSAATQRALLQQGWNSTNGSNFPNESNSTNGSNSTDTAGKWQLTGILTIVGAVVGGTVVVVAGAGCVLRFMCWLQEPQSQAEAQDGNDNDDGGGGGPDGPGSGPGAHSGAAIVHPPRGSSPSSPRPQALPMASLGSGAGTSTVVVPPAMGVIPGPSRLSGMTDRFFVPDSPLRRQFLRNQAAYVYRDIRSEVLPFSAIDSDLNMVNPAFRLLQVIDTFQRERAAINRETDVKRRAELDRVYREYLRLLNTQIFHPQELLDRPHLATELSEALKKFNKQLPPSSR